MANQSPPPSPGASGPHRRRSSIADLFNPRGTSSSIVPASPTTSTSTSVPSSMPVPVQKRGMSITALGLAGSNNTSPYNAFAKQRRASISTSNGSGSPEFRNSFGDEPAVIEEDDRMQVTPTTPATPSFARRVSFGAQVMRERAGSNIGASGGGEGFNWSEALRDNTKKRSPSFSSSGNPFASRVQGRSVSSGATMEPPQEMPKPVVMPAKIQKPDHLGERMLRGDFMMD